MGTTAISTRYRLIACYLWKLKITCGFKNVCTSLEIGPWKLAIFMVLLKIFALPEGLVNFSNISSFLDRLKIAICRAPMSAGSYHVATLCVPLYFVFMWVSSGGYRYFHTTFSAPNRVPMLITYFCINWLRVIIIRDLIILDSYLGPQPKRPEGNADSPNHRSYTTIIHGLLIFGSSNT